MNFRFLLTIAFALSISTLLFAQRFTYFTPRDPVFIGSQYSPPNINSTPISTPMVTPTPTSGITFGVNGHDARPDYPLSQADARFALLSQKRLSSYRVDVSADTSGITMLDALVPLAQQYGIVLRPMLYPTTQSAAYTFARRYANSIKVWEIGNEINLLGRGGAQQRMPAVVATYNGIMQASNELGADLKTTMNFTACNDDYPGSVCYAEPAGAAWVLDMAWNAGFHFDYISFHYYAFYGERGYWYDKYFGQMRAAATRYDKKVFLNEFNGAEIYTGTTNGGYPGDHGVYDSVTEYINEVRTRYSDIVLEMDIYEFLDEAVNPEVPPGPEQHFGIMYNINSPKPLFTLMADFAAGSGTPTPTPTPTPSPTPTTAIVSGRVTTPSGQGLRNAVVSMIDAQGMRRMATTSSFGVYIFENVLIAPGYTLTVSSKRYRFAPKTMDVTGNFSNVNFVGLE